MDYERRGLYSINEKKQGIKGLTVMEHSVNIKVQFKFLRKHGLKNIYKTSQYFLIIVSTLI